MLVIKIIQFKSRNILKMTLETSPYESAPVGVWHSIYSYYTADTLVDNPDHLKMMESIVTKKAPVHFEHYMGWLATRVEPLLTESRKNALSAFPDAEKIHHLLLQLRSEGVDLSSVTLSPYNSKMHVDVDDEPLASSAEECYGIEHAIRLGDEIINLVKIATRIPGYTPLATGTDAEKVEHFRTWARGNRVHCAAQSFLNLSHLGLTTFPSELASYFPNIFSLYLERNQFTSINLERLTRLEYVSLSDNKLTSVSLRGLARLEFVNLSRNKLSSIAFKTIERFEGLTSSVSISEIYLSMHDLNVALEADVRSEIIKKYNEIKNPDYPDYPHFWETSGEDFFISGGGAELHRKAFLKAIIQVVLERLDGVIT